MDSTNTSLTAEGLNAELRKHVIYPTIFVGIEACLAFIGNFAVLSVFFFRYNVSNFRYFVLCLSFLDFISTFTTMTGEMITEHYWYIYPMKFQWFCKTKSFCNMFTVTAEAFCLCAIAADRFRKVCRPFSWQIKPPQAIKICGVIYILAIVVAFPVPFFWGVHSYNRIENGVAIHVTVCEKDQLYLDTAVHGHYIKFLLVFMPIILMVTLFLYICIAVKMYRRRAERKAKTYTSPDCKRNASSNMKSLTFTANGLPNGTSIFIQEEKLSDTGTGNNVLEDNNSQSNDVCDGVVKVNLDVPGRRQRLQDSESSSRVQTSRRVRKKTIIMVILTFVFSITVIEYLTCLATVAHKNDVLPSMSNSGKAAFFFALRLVFINHVINPLVIFFFDRQFRKGIISLKSSVLEKIFFCNK